MDKSVKKLYTKKLWYNNTYNSLGSAWLIKTLNQLQLPIGYVFVNVSANAGYYERDAYEAHKEEYRPRYYIGDLYAPDLTDKKVASYENFTYLQGDNNAISMDVGILPEKADIVLDCKGALWHCLKSGTQKQVVSLLDNYIHMLKDNDSVLVLDYYMCVGKMAELKNDFFWHFVLRGNSRNKKRILRFGECSTYSLLSRYISESVMVRLFTYLNVKSCDESKPLAAIMDTMYISRRELTELKEVFQSFSKVKYVFCRGIISNGIKIMPYLWVIATFLIGILLYY